jgi:hypothetical protein
MRRLTLAVVIVAALSVSSSAAAQTSSDGTAQELYHAHFVKAALGKLADLIAAYTSAPVPPGEQKPIILRHREGDDWDLLVLTPFGKAASTVSATVPPDIQSQYAKIRANSERHTDSFVAGPPWAQAQKAFGSDAGGVYVVGVYRSANGHRDQLGQALDSIAASGPAGRTATIRQVEGGPFDFIQITHFDSWNAIDAPGAGQTDPQAQSLELRRHMAEHHDTICIRVGQ